MPYQKRRRMVTMVLAAVFIIAAAGLAAAGDAPAERVLASFSLDRSPSLNTNIARPTTLGGIVREVDPEAGTLTIMQRGGTVTVPVAPHATVVVDGEPVTLAQLPTGANARLSLENRVAVRVVVQTPFAHEAAPGDDGVSQLLGGTVESVDPAAGTLTLRTRTASLTVQVAEGATILIDGAAARLAEIEPRSSARITLADRVAVRINVASPAVSRPAPTAPGDAGPLGGTVRHVNLEEGTLSLATGRSTVTVQVAQDATIVINGEPARLAALAVGSQARVTLEDRVAVRIEARQVTEALRERGEAVRERLQRFRQERAERLERFRQEPGEALRGERLERIRHARGEATG